MPSTDEQRCIYMDYAATAPLREEAYAAMLPHLKVGLDGICSAANPNSLHTPGREAFKAYEGARRQLANAIGAKRPDEVIFTSGATEADNMAVFGIAKGAAEKRAKPNDGSQFRVITCAIEHDAVLEPMSRLQKEGFEVVFLKPDRQGFVTAESLRDALTDATVLVSIQTANSEVGSIQPVKEFAEMAHGVGAVFHTDATQALGKIPIDMQRLGVDAASFSSHKVGGPRGMGALYLKQRTPFLPQMLGGGQESSLRSGTQNVAGACGFAAAAESAVSEAEQEGEREQKLRDELYARISFLPEYEATVEVPRGSLDYLPNIANFMVKGLESETSVIRFDSLGICVSGGSACASRSLAASHVLLAMGVKPDRALEELRFSIGRSTTEKDVDAACEAAKKVVNWGRR